MQQDYLYPVTIYYRCGHHKTIQAGGSRITRSQMAHNLGKGDCPECEAVKGGKEVIFINGAEFVLEAITTGTDKQIEWAVKIRKRFVKALLKKRFPGENPIAWMRFLSSARWWIDHRDSDPVDLLADFKKAA